jgi:hypothetical protein
MAWADEEGGAGAGAGAETISPTGADEGGPDGGGGSEGSSDGVDGPATTVGNGRTGEPDPEPAAVDSGVKPGAGEKPQAKVNGFVIPMLRIPTYEEFAAPGVTPPAAYFGTMEIPTLEDVLRAFSQPEPEPEPAPGPAFRTQEDAPPVIDAAGDAGGGGMDPTGGEPPVFEAPLVVAPVPPLIAPRVAPLGTAASGGPSVTAGVAPATAGVRAPLIRGTLPPSAVSPPNSAATLSNGQAIRVGYPRYLRNPTVGELAAVALPGVGGLIFLTFSGGVIGYRQANSGRYVRTAAAARFLP